MAQVGLRLHPDKTRIVYCQDERRRAAYEHTEFTFLGFTFRQRTARAKNGRMFRSFLPAISKDALKKISAEVRSWRLHHRTGVDLVDVAKEINPIVRGWMKYYGAFYRSALYPLLARINAYLMRWIRKKYKRLRAKKKALRCWRRIVQRCPRMFAHWAWATGPLSGDQDDKSPVTGDCHARICGSPGVKSPGLPDADRTMIRAWTCSARGRASTIPGRPGSSRRGSPPTLTAWTTWSGCAGRTASPARAASTPAAGRSGMAGTSAPAAGSARR